MPPPPLQSFFFFFFNDTATTEIYTLSLHDALPILHRPVAQQRYVDPHRVHVRPDPHALVGAVDALQVVLADPDPDEAVHVGRERGVVPGVGGPDHEPGGHHRTWNHLPDGAREQCKALRLGARDGRGVAHGGRERADGDPRVVHHVAHVLHHATHAVARQDSEVHQRAGGGRQHVFLNSGLHDRGRSGGAQQRPTLL